VARKPHWAFETQWNAPHCAIELQKLQLELQPEESAMMADAMSEPIPKKQRQVEAFAEAMIPSLWCPRSTWVPDKENSVGERTRSLQSELSTEPGDSNGKNLTKSFKICRSGNPEEWMLWQCDFNEVCVGLDIQTGASCNRMVRQLLLDQPLKEFERILATFPLKTQANCNLALVDAVAVLIFPNNARAKQKKPHMTRIVEPKGPHDWECPHQAVRAQQQNGSFTQTVQKKQ
jgi:hypothetical protein